ncbi:unnamed protein product [Protopolystoma xenopodis]|uniref:Uncharacterized protein n=1 Tax=Protopolystoma xenopodis TaxID=117903 RepID=A0A3S5AJU0_9PLAT|nr:unnamed protein product [Protopolystoma xenopodis]
MSSGINFASEKDLSTAYLRSFSENKRGHHLEEESNQTKRLPANIRLDDQMYQLFLGLPLDTRQLLSASAGVFATLTMIRFVLSDWMPVWLFQLDSTRKACKRCRI